MKITIKSVKKIINWYNIIPEITYNVTYNNGRIRTYEFSIPATIKNFISTHDAIVREYDNGKYIVESYK